MKKFQTPAFIGIPALLFLVAAGALVFLRKPPVSPAFQHPPIHWDTLAADTPVDTFAPLPDAQNPFIQRVSLDEETERVKAVKQCGSCHQQAYQNWSDGPHAHSYRSMRKLYESAQDSIVGYFPRSYGKWIHQNMRVCFQCHATENLYETNFKGVELEADLGRVNDTVFPNLHQMGKPRTDPKTFTTGVDCFTCHYNGERVITGASFKPDPAKTQMPGYCNPLPTPFFTTNTNCVTCHHFAASTQQANLDRGMHFEETNCIRCHQAYDSKGKGTHFYQWRFADHRRHPESHAKGGLFESLRVHVEKGESSRLTLDWANTISPHGLTECGEVVLEIVVQDQGGKQVLKESIRLNRKAVHDTILREQLLGEEPPGVVGYPFDPSDPPIHEVFTLKGKDIRSGRILLTAIDKGQYWGDDRIGVEVYKRTIRF